MNALLSGSLLSAALLMGQTNDTSKSSIPPPPSLPSAQPATDKAPAQRSPIMGWFSREDRPVLGKITSWFKREPAPEAPPPAAPVKGILQREPIKSATQPAVAPTPTPAATETPPANDFPRRMPNPTSKAPTDAANPLIIELSPAATKVVSANAQEPAPAPNPIKAQFANKIGRDEKFAWITGQLELEDGIYVIYYGSPTTMDKYRGRIAIQPEDVDMKGLHRGDLVSVHGQLIERPGNTGPIYRLTAANLIERPTR